MKKKCFAQWTGHFGVRQSAWVVFHPSVWCLNINWPNCNRDTKKWILLLPWNNWHYTDHISLRLYWVHPLLTEKRVTRNMLTEAFSPKICWPKVCFTECCLTEWLYSRKLLYRTTIWWNTFCRKSTTHWSKACWSKTLHKLWERKYIE